MCGRSIVKTGPRSFLHIMNRKVSLCKSILKIQRISTVPGVFISLGNVCPLSKDGPCNVLPVIARYLCKAVLRSIFGKIRQDLVRRNRTLDKAGPSTRTILNGEDSASLYGSEDVGEFVFRVLRSMAVVSKGSVHYSCPGGADAILVWSNRFVK